MSSMIKLIAIVEGIVRTTLNQIIKDYEAGIKHPDFDDAVINDIKALVKLNNVVQPFLVAMVATLLDANPESAIGVSYGGSKGVIGYIFTPKMYEMFKNLSQGFVEFNVSEKEVKH